MPSVVSTCCPCADVERLSGKEVVRQFAFLRGCGDMKSELGTTWVNGIESRGKLKHTPSSPVPNSDQSQK